ncbi:PilZ domain-containing protein [Thermohalobacter berrensis]|uniref:PilZ domain-containing protein n=1 Tax=Thermohalobacter berrensis TaxID=99594 RepID=A0A419SWD7_9FIRM|nr:PilZ domain-containing protein [Thermohalobacter berrensis]RKD29532.1 hypothetical protein BET03_05590 [Thermohalobacter berrensis]
MNNQETNRRKFFRIYFNAPLCSEISIIMVNGEKVNTGTTRVCIEDIGPGGLRFLSYLKLPDNAEIILQFNTRILGKNQSFNGEIVWSKKRNSELWQYGVKFIVDDATQNKYVGLLNRLLIRLKKIKILSDCSFCSSENKIRCLRGF